jgi:hypothetical protein
VRVSIPARPVIQRDLGTASGDTIVDVCDRQAATLTVIAGAEAARYEWYRDGTIVEVTTRNTLTTAAAGQYSVRVYDGCNRQYAASRVVRIIARQRPEIALQPQVSMLVKEGESIELTFVLAQGIGPFTYQWFRDGVAVAGATDAALRINASELSDAGIYTCRIQNACGSIITRRSEVRVYRPVATSVDDVSTGGLQLTCSPNPVGDHGVIDVATALEGHLTVRVVDARGRVVAILANEVRPAGIHRVALEGAALPADGIYTIIAEHATGTISRQIILQR